MNTATLWTDAETGKIQMEGKRGWSGTDYVLIFTFHERPHYTAKFMIERSIFFESHWKKFRAYSNVSYLDLKKKKKGERECWCVPRNENALFDWDQEGFLLMMPSKV